MNAPAPIKLLIIGGVAAGATAAARARRLNEHAQITVIERGPYMSYANCGLPYFLSRDIQKRSSLLLQTPEGFEARYGVQVLVNTEALEIDRHSRNVLVQTAQGQQRLSYDRLILAQGGSPILPPIPGADGSRTFRLWTIPDMDRVHEAIDRLQAKSAVIVGAGFIGLEMAEALHKRGLQTSIVEFQPQVMPTMDSEIGYALRTELERMGVRVLTSTQVAAVNSDEAVVTLGDGSSLAADLVLFSVGVRPNLDLARKAGLTIGSAGGLQVDEFLQTSDPAIYAAGDMIETVHRVSGHSMRVPLAGPANRQGRIAASNALGGTLRYRGVIGTSVVKVFEVTAAATGLTEKAAREQGIDTGVAIVARDHHAGYYPGAKELLLKMIFDRRSGRLLGAQASGQEGVDKRIDALAAALHREATLQDLAEMDFAYAPPYSSANDAINIAAFVGLNDLEGYSPTITAAQLLARMKDGQPLFLLDVRTEAEYSRGHLKGAVNLSVDDLRYEMDRVPKELPIIIYCRSGYRGHLALRILRGHGYQNVANLTGGYLCLEQVAEFAKELA